MHQVYIVLEVDSEPETVTAARSFRTDAEVVSIVAEFLKDFVKPDRGRQRIIISVASSPDQSRAVPVSEG